MTAGWYKKISEFELAGPGFPMFGLLNRRPTYDDPPTYAPYPVRGWTWQEDGEHGAGYYHTDGSFKTGRVDVTPMDYVTIRLDSIDRTPCYGWYWFDTPEQAYAFFNLPMPPVQWSGGIAFEVGAKCQTDRVYICTQAGTSDEYGMGPQEWMGDTGIVDGTVIWDAVLT